MIQNFPGRKKLKLKLKIKSTILLSKKLWVFFLSTWQSCLVSFSTSVLSQVNACKRAGTYDLQEIYNNCERTQSTPYYIQVVFASWQTGNDNLAKILVTCLHKWTGFLPCFTSHYQSKWYNTRDIVIQRFMGRHTLCECFWNGIERVGSSQFFFFFYCFQFYDC